MIPNQETRIANLERKLAEMQAVIEELATFEPTVVDLRIDGAVRSVVLFAREQAPTTPTFTVVPRE